MNTVKRREVKIPFTKNERNGFISMETARMTFHKVLHRTDIELYYKWLYFGQLTNAEKDQLAICSRIARKMTETK